MRRGAFSLLLVSMLSAPTFADEVEEFAQHLSKAVGAFEAVNLYHQQCDARQPPQSVAHKDAVAAWSYDNGRADYERVMTAIEARLPEIAQQIRPQVEAIGTEIEADLDRAPEQCADLAGLLEDDQFDVRSSVRRLLSLARDLDIDVPDAPEIVPAVKSAETVQIVRLASLSARLKAKMAEVGSQEGARNSSSLRMARAEYAEAWLEADGIQVLFARVIDDDEMREWRGDTQSAFTLDCHSFSTDAHEERMAASIGLDMVVVGTPRRLVETISGGTIGLDRCSLFTVDEVGRPFLDEDDSAGLVLRPPEFEEAYAGPGQGIALNEVDRVLYQSSFDNRLDGFGNGYIEREEAIYVLLRDGSAYRHDWSFPFTDLDVALSRQREPDHWYGWSETGEGLLLTGPDETEEEIIDLTKAQVLQAFTPRTIEAEYYYLQIGMGGSRQDRRYVFAKDGTVLYRRGGFVAGNVGTSYIIVNGTDDPEVRARYRFEDYALILETAEREERHFLAMPRSADAALPDTLLIDGTAYWLDDK